MNMRAIVTWWENDGIWSRSREGILCLLFLHITFKFQYKNSPSIATLLTIIKNMTIHDTLKLCI